MPWDIAVELIATGIIAAAILLTTWVMRQRRRHRERRQRLEAVQALRATAEDRLTRMQAIVERAHAITTEDQP